MIEILIVIFSFVFIWIKVLNYIIKKDKNNYLNIISKILEENLKDYTYFSIKDKYLKNIEFDYFKNQDTIFEFLYSQNKIYFNKSKLNEYLLLWNFEIEKEILLSFSEFCLDNWKFSETYINDRIYNYKWKYPFFFKNLQSKELEFWFTQEETDRKMFIYWFLQECLKLNSKFYE